MHYAGSFSQPRSHYYALPSRDRTPLLVRAICRLIAFVFILALANLGTSFASAVLAKDTTTSNGELVDVETNEAVATAEAVKVFTVGADDGKNARKLCTVDIDTTNAGICDMATTSAITMSVANGAAMIADCANNKLVQLHYTSGGATTSRTICGPSWCSGSTFYTSGNKADLCQPYTLDKIQVTKQVTKSGNYYTLSKDIFATPVAPVDPVVPVTGGETPQAPEDTTTTTTPTRV